MPKLKENILNTRNGNILEEKYKYLVNNLSDIVIEAELNGNFTYVSQQAYNILGYYPEEVIGVSGFKFIHPEDLPKVAEAMRNLATSKKSLSVEYRVFHKNGNIIYVSAKGNIVNIEGGMRIVAVLSDITDRFKHEQELKESEERYRLITENAISIVWTVDMNLKRTFVSPAVSKLLGYTLEETLNNPLTHKFTKESFDELSRIYREELKNEKIKGMDPNRTRIVETKHRLHGIFL